VLNGCFASLVNVTHCHILFASLVLLTGIGGHSWTAIVALVKTIRIPRFAPPLRRCQSCCNTFEQEVDMSGATEECKTCKTAFVHAMIGDEQVVVDVSSGRIRPAIAT